MSPSAPTHRAWWIPFSWFVTGCAPTDCLTLGGGHPGVNLAALENECLSDEAAYDCESENFVERDTIVCLALGDWSTEIDEAHGRELYHSWTYHTVVWQLWYDSDCVSVYSATTAEELSADTCG